MASAFMLEVHSSLGKSATATSRCQTNGSTWRIQKSRMNSAIIGGCTAESLNHPEALFHMNTGSRLGADPALGAWATYGLGSVNQNLPGTLS